MKFEKLQEEIENILYGVQNTAGNSHIFNTELCTDVAKEIIGTLKRHLTNTTHSGGKKRCFNCGSTNLEYDGTCRDC